MDEATGKVRIEYEADLSRYAKSVEQMERDTRQSAARMASGFSGAFAKTLNGKAGGQTVKEFLRGITEEFERSTGNAKESLARGLIDKGGMRKAGTDAAKTFNQSLQAEIERRGVAGTLDDQSFRQLSRRLKTAGMEGGEQLTEGIEAGAKPGLSRLDRFFQNAFRFLIAGAVVRGLQSIATGIDNLLSRASRLDQLSNAFKNITFNAGTDDVAVLKSLQQATNGLVTRFDLIQRANIALQAGLPGTAEQMGRLAYVARRMAETVGIDAGEAFERLVNGIAKGETEILQQLGLLTRQEDAYRAWEQQTGRNSDELDGQTKMLIYYNAILAEAEGKVRALGEETLTAGQRLQQAKIFIRDVADATALAVANAPGLIAFFEDLGVGAQNSAGRVDQLANRIASFVDTLFELRAVVDSIGGPMRLLTVSPQEFDRAFDAVADMNFQRRERLSAIAVGEGDDLKRIRDALQVELQRVATQNQINRARQAELEGEERRGGTGFKPWYMETDKHAELAELQRNATLEAKKEFDIRTAILAVEERRIDLARTPVPRPTGGGTGSGLSIDERNRLLEQADRLRADNTAALKELTSSAMDEALFQLERLEEDAREVFRKLGQDLPAEIAQGFEQRRAAIIGAMDLEGFTRDFEALGESPASAEANDALRDHIDALKAYVDAHDEAGGILAEGTALRDRFNDQLKQTERQLAQNEKALRDEALEGEEAARKLIEDRKRAEEERLRNLRDSARALEENARAGLQMAEALGLIDSEAGKALQSIVQLGTSIARIYGGDVTAIPSAIGAAANLFGLLSERGAQAEQRRLEVQRGLIDQLEENRRALEENTRAIASGRTTSDITAGAAAAAGVKGILGGLKIDTDLMTDPTLKRFLQDALRDPTLRAGLSQAGEVAGIDLLGAAEKTVELGDVGIFRSAWDAVREILQEASEHFGGIAETNFDGQMERFREEIELLDLDSATEQLDHFLKVLRSVGAGDFASQIEGLVAGGDFEGARELVRNIFGQMLRGELTAAGASSLFGGNATPEDIRRILSDVNGWLEQIAEEGIAADAGVSRSLSVDRTITEVTGSRLLGAVLTGNLFEEATARNTTAMLALMRGQPVVTVPSLAQLGLSHGGSTSRVEFGAMPVEVSVAVSVSGDTPADWQAAGRQIAAGINSTIDQQLGNRLRDLERAAGR